VEGAQGEVAFVRRAPCLMFSLGVSGCSSAGPNVGSEQNNMAMRTASLNVYLFSNISDGCKSCAALHGVPCMGPDNGPRIHAPTPSSTHLSLPLC